MEFAEAFEEGVLDKPSQVKGYTEMPEAPSVAGLQTNLDEAMLDRLKSIGYIGDGAEQPAEGQ